MRSKNRAPKWAARVLRLAAAFDVLLGVYLVVDPTGPFSWAGLPSPSYPQALQFLGIVIAVHGLGYAFAARRPQQLWPVVLVGLLVKVLVPLSFVAIASRDPVPWELGLLVFAFGPIWWAPLGLVLLETARVHRADQAPPTLPLDMALSFFRDREGLDLLEASKEQPQFLVFLRHFGCTFCREALADLAAIHERLRELGTRLVLVHMSSDEEAREFVGPYGLQDATAISDPDRVLYRAFALRSGSPTQLFGWTVWKRGWDAGVKQGHGVGWLRGDAAQMPGAFVVSRGHVVAQFVHETAADRPDYVVIAEEGADQAEFQNGLEADGLGLGFQNRLRQALSSEPTGPA